MREEKQNSWKWNEKPNFKSVKLQKIWKHRGDELSKMHHHPEEDSFTQNKVINSE